MRIHHTGAVIQAEPCSKIAPKGFGQYTYRGSDTS